MKVASGSRGAAPRPLTGRRVLWIVVGFFAVVFAVNGVFVHLSLTSHPGTTAADAYREGLDYNRRLERADLQRTLGWRARLGAEDGAVFVRMTDADGAPVAGLSAELRVGRPASDAEDRAVGIEEAGPGVYRVTGPPLGPGRWAVVLELADRAGRRFRVEERIVVGP